MNFLKTILCAIFFVTTAFAGESFDIFEPDRDLMRQLPVVESPDPFGIDRLISSEDTPFVGEAIPLNIRTVGAVNLVDDFSKEKENGSADGTQASNNDQTPKVEIEQTGDDAELGDNLEIKSLKSVDIVLDDKEVKEIPPASVGCCVIQ